MITTIIGSIGAFLILFSFVMNQWHKWKDDYLIYDMVNFIGAGLLCISAIMLKSIPFAILNGTWSLISLRDVYLDIRKKRKNHNWIFNRWLK